MSRECLAALLVKEGVRGDRVLDRVARSHPGSRRAIRHADEVAGEARLMCANYPSPSRTINMITDRPLARRASSQERATTTAITWPTWSVEPSANRSSSCLIGPIALLPAAGTSAAVRIRTTPADAAAY